MPDVGCRIAYGASMTRHESKTDPSLSLSKNTIAHSFKRGEAHMSCLSVAKTQSVSNFSKITARDGSAHPSVTVQRYLV